MLHRLLALLCCTLVLTGGEAAFSVADHGLASLTWGDWQFLGDAKTQGAFNLWGPVSTFRQNDGTLAKGAKDATGTRHDGDTVIATYAWGTVKAAWSRPAPDRIACRITVANSATQPLLAVDGCLFVLDTPTVPRVQSPDGDGSAKDRPFTVDSLIGPPLLVLDLAERGTLALCLEGDPRARWRLGQLQSFNSEKRWSVRWFCDEPVPPGQERCMDLSLRFLPTGTTWRDAAPDLLMRYAGIWQPVGARGDRRPIGRDFICNPPPHPPKNPRGWFQNDATIDITTPAGLENLRQRMLARADALVTHLHSVDAQGLVLWDIEGQQEPHMTSYVGSPDRLPEIAPEMEWRGDHPDSIADAFFARIRAANLRIGLCLRPQRYTGAAPTGPYQQVEVADPWTVIRAKVDYAYRRWGATLFYVDSNVDDRLGWPIPDRLLFSGALADHPDIRLMAEWQNCGTWGTGAPYDASCYDNVVETNQRVREVWPDAHSCIAMGDAKDGRKLAELIPAFATAIRHGDIMLFDAWFDSDSRQALVAAQKIAGRRPTCALDVADGVTRGQPLTLTAITTPGDDAVRQVVFRSGGVAIATVTAPPWQAMWTPTVAGPHSLTATAVDAQDRWTVSDAHAVVVRP